MPTKVTVKTEDENPQIISRSIVVDLGSTRRKRIKQLKRGQGRLVDEVRGAVEIAAAQLGEEAEGKVLVPVVVVYRRKSPTRKRRGPTNEGMCPILCC